MMEKVCAVVVVFDHHKTYVSTVIERLSKENVVRVIVVNNGNKKVDFLKGQSSANFVIEIIETDKNLGSAGGFKLGIEKALTTNSDFIWLIDEDNYAADGSLRELLIRWRELLPQSADPSKMMLCSYRPHLFNTLNIRFEDNYLKLSPRQNGFLGFNVNHLNVLIFRRLKKLFGFKRQRKFREILDQGEPVQLDSCPYGGTFFHRSLKQLNILPDEKMVLYWDDIEFTNNFHRNNGSIFLVPQSEIIDMDSRKMAQDRLNIFYHPLIDLAPSFKAYFYARNLMTLEKKHFRNNVPKYLVNKCLMLCLLFTMCFFRAKIKRFKLLLVAMNSIKRIRQNNSIN